MSAAQHVRMLTGFPRIVTPEFLYRVEDPVIAGVTYFPRDERLYLGFRNRITVCYWGVPGRLYRALLDAQPDAWTTIAEGLATFTHREVTPLPVLRVGPPPLL